MNKIFLTVFLSLICVGNTETDDEKVVLGILDGFGNQIGLEDIINCANDIKSGFYDIDNAINTMSHEHDLRRIRRIKDGLEDLGHAVIDLFHAYETCPKIASDVKKIISTLKSFTDPVTFIYHIGKDLIVNRVHIYHEIKNAISSWRSHNYFTFGQQIGDILGQLIFN